MAFTSFTLDASIAWPQDIFSLSTSLHDICHRIQHSTLHTSHPQFLLRSTTCQALAKSYAVALQFAVHQQLHKLLALSLSPITLSLKLTPSLSALYSVMLEGERFILNCCARGRDEFLKKAVVLALSTEAVDVHLHDLLWCVFVVNAAVDELSGAAYRDYDLDISWSSIASLQKEHEIYGLLNNIWAETMDEAEDVNVVLDALAKIKVAEEGSVTPDIRTRLADFLFHKLSRTARQGDVINDDSLPPCLWVDPHDFQIIEPLGEGACAVVYEVEWLGERLARKEFFGVNKESLGSEPVIQARLRHPNLVQLVCCTENAQRKNVSLVMELMPQNLRDLIIKNIERGFNPPFSVAVAMDLMLQIAKGMEYLHGLHIMHRDLKSLNILVNSGDSNRPNGRVRVKIADFGMSKAKHLSSMYTTLPAGTLNWRAPEVFETRPEDEEEGVIGAKYTKKADVYSFAMVCYEILTGKIPWDGFVKPNELRSKLMKGVRPKLPSSCPPGLASFIEKCWHGTASERPSFPQISRALRYLTAILFSGTDPIISSSTLKNHHGYIHSIEEKLVKHLGIHWSKGAGSSMSIPFEMSCYQAMARIIERESVELLASEGFSISTDSDSAYTEHEKNSSVSTCHVVTTPPKRDLSNLSKGSILPHVKKLFSRLSLERAGNCQLHCEPELKIARKFTYKELDIATMGFSRIIGKGGSGTVFWGNIPTNQEIAVKLYSAASRQRVIRFSREAKMLGRLRHHNLVQLLGWCNDGGNLLLIYEHMPNGSLHQHLFGAQDHMVLSWQQRCNILHGVALALNYLHHNSRYMQVVHRDVKANNVLLDLEWNARLGDFGLAKITKNGFCGEEDCVEGSIGYMAPEYLSTGKFGTPSDIYSFGLLVLEVVCGKRCLDYDSDSTSYLLETVHELHEANKLLDVADPKLQGSFDKVEMIGLILLGLECCQFNHKQRPTMQRIVQSLEELLPSPSINRKLEYNHNILKQ